MMNILIIEDEIPAARQLERLLKRSPHFEGSINGPCTGIADSVDHLKNSEAYDLIFMDIHLSDGPSFEIFNQLQLDTPIIFCTAYDQYALEAFKLNSIDYLLKPVEPDDLDRALMKYKSFYNAPQQELPSMSSLLKSLQGLKPDASKKKRFLIKIGDRILSKPVHEVACFFSADKATYLLDQEHKSYPIDYSLDQVEEMLTSEDFFRINRKYLIRLESIADMRSYSGSRIKLRINGSDDDDILVSRDKTAAFKAWLDR